MSAPTYKKIEEKRQTIIAQAFRDQNATWGARYYHVNLFHEAILEAYAQGKKDGIEGIQEKDVKKLVDAFLAWPLPESLCCDTCVIERNYPNRSGTNLLSAEEARQMFEYVLSKSKEKKP